MKKFISIVLALCFALGATLTASAASQYSDVEKPISVSENAKIIYENDDYALVQVEPLTTQRSSGYGYSWINSVEVGSFTVYTPYEGTLGFTFKIEAEDDSSDAYVSVEKPNGNYYWNNVYVPNSREVLKKAYYASSGTYTIHYNAYTSAGMRLMCWIYKK